MTLLEELESGMGRRAGVHSRDGICMLEQER